MSALDEAADVLEGQHGAAHAELDRLRAVASAARLFLEYCDKATDSEPFPFLHYDQHEKALRIALAALGAKA